MRYFIIFILSLSLEAKSLKEVINYSLKHNYQIEILKEQIDITNRESKIKEVWSDPILKVGINDIQSKKPLNRDSEAMQNQFVSISQAIPLSNRLELSSKIEKIKSKIIEQKIDILKVDIAFKIREAFIEVLYAKKSLDIIDEYISFLQKPINLLNDLSTIERSSIEKYIKTQLLKNRYRLQRENYLEKIDIAKESVELIGNIKIDSFDGRVTLREYNQESLDAILDKIYRDNPKLKMIRTLKSIARESLSLAKAEEIADITITAGVYQRFKRDDYISLSISYPLYIRDRQQNRTIQALKRVNIEDINYEKSRVELAQALKIDIHRLNSIDNELDILNRNMIEIKNLIHNSKSELTVGGSLLHYYELFTKKIDNLLALNEKELEKSLIQNRIMKILGGIE